MKPTSVRLDTRASEALGRLQAIYGHESRSSAIEEAVAGWECTLWIATQEVENLFSRGEWNYLADALNGCLLMFEGMGNNPGGFLAIQCWDCHALNGYGEKWLADDPELAAEEARALCAKLQALSFAQGWAVLRTAQWFWANHAEIDHQEDEWWTLAHRRKARKAEADGE